MDILNELIQCFDDINNFKAYINRQVESDAQFLYRTFWLDGYQVSVLNYLIEHHGAQDKNLINCINYVLEKG